MADRLSAAQITKRALSLLSSNTVVRCLVRMTESACPTAPRREVQFSTINGVR